MDEYSFVAHALRDFLRMHVGPSELKIIDGPLLCGEALSAICAELAIAVDFKVALPSTYIAHVMELPGLNDRDKGILTQLVQELPRYEFAA